MSGTSIEYMNVGAKKGETWNPWIGCSPISPGCKNCWARREEDGRLRHLGRCIRHDDPKDGPVRGEPYFHRGPVFQDKAVGKPFGWKKPRMIL